MKRSLGQHIRPSYYHPIQKQLDSLFYSVIFEPLLEILSKTTDQTLLNAKANALETAIRSGRIQYEGGIFSGQFNSETSRILRAIGAQWDAQSKVYRLNASQVPAWIKAEAAARLQTARGANDMLKKRLSEIEASLDHVIDKKPISYRQTMDAVQSDFREVAKLIEVHPTLHPISQHHLAEDYSNNMKLYVKDFSKQMIFSLRDAVEKNAMEGYRFDKLIPSIRNRYGVTRNKAKFLARQETGLFMSKYRRQRFGEAGITKYKWSTSHDERVRPMLGASRSNNHRILDGRVFAYTQPPVVDTATGRRANPGEDFNCRCVDLPILEEVLS